MTILDIMGDFTTRVGFNNLFAIGGIIFVLGTLLFIIELAGYTITLKGIIKQRLKWDSLDVATTSMCAALLGGALAATGGLTVIPGFTWFRPANALIPLFGILFGIPGCLGAAIGNLIGDAFGGYLSAGSLGGFIGCFFGAYIPYKMIKDHSLRSKRGWIEYYMWAVIISSGAISFYISSWADFINLMPENVIWTFLFNFIFLNGAIPTAIIGPFLVLFLYPKVTGWGMYWKDRITFESK